jgi:hypothetical protein
MKQSSDGECVIEEDQSSVAPISVQALLQFWKSQFEVMIEARCDAICSNRTHRSTYFCTAGWESCDVKILLPRTRAPLQLASIQGPAERKQTNCHSVYLSGRNSSSDVITLSVCPSDFETVNQFSEILSSLSFYFRCLHPVANALRYLCADWNLTPLISWSLSCHYILHLSCTYLIRITNNNKITKRNFDIETTLMPLGIKYVYSKDMQLLGNLLQNVK